MSHPEAPDPDGGQGADAPSRSDLKLIERAVRQRWPIDPATRAQLVKLLAVTATTADDDRTIVAASRALLEADKINLEQERRDQKIPDYHEHQHQGQMAVEHQFDPEYVAQVMQILHAHGPASSSGPDQPEPAQVEPPPTDTEASGLPEPDGP